jgi:hypothetical protein
MNKNIYKNVTPLGLVGIQYLFYNNITPLGLVYTINLIGHKMSTLWGWLVYTINLILFLSISPFVIDQKSGDR